MDDRQIWAFIDAQYRAGKERRALWEESARNQLMWVEGDQNRRWNVKSNDAEQILLELERYIPFEFRRPITINKLLGIMVQKIALTLGGTTTLHPQPMTDSDPDVASARMQTRLLRYLWYSGPENLRRRIIWALWQVFGTGICWAHPFWDPTYGEPQLFGPELEENDDDEAREKKIGLFRAHVATMQNKQPEQIDLDQDGGITLPPGQADWKFHSGFNVTEPEFVTTFKQLQHSWLLVTEWMSMEEIRATYGEDATKDIDPETTDGRQYYLQEYGYNYGQHGRVLEGSTRTRREIVQVHSLWRARRWPHVPKGALLVCAQGGTVLHKGPHPYVHGRLPLVPMTEFPSDRIRPPCTIGNLMDMQHARNTLRSQVRQAIYVSIAPKHLVDENALVEAKDLDSESRAIKVKSGRLHDAHKPLIQPKLATDVWREDELLRQEMQEVGQIHDSTRGRGETKQQSGRHAALMAQGDSRATLVTRELLQGAIAEASNQTLWLWWQFAKGKRAMMISGEDYNGEFFEFSADDLYKGKEAPQPYYFNVTCELGMDMTLEQGLAKTDAMVKLKLWDPANPAHAQRIGRALGEKNYDPTDPGARQRIAAQRENKKLLEVTDVDGFRLDPTKRSVHAVIGDIHDLHVFEHERFTTTDEYRETMRKRPEVQEVFEIHRQAHLFLAARQAREVEVIDAMVEKQIEQEMQRMAEIVEAMGGVESQQPEGEPSPAPVRFPARGRAVPIEPAGAATTAVGV